MDPEIAARAAALSGALSKLPDRRGPVFRGAAYLMGNSFDPRSGRQVISMMEATDLPQAPISGEIRAAEKRVREFLKKINAVLEADRQPLTSDKFAGPIAEIVV